MNKIYEEYIRLGFERDEINDKVVFRETGYNGYILRKKLNEKISIEVCYPELDKPILFVQKAKKESEVHWIYINFDQVESFLKAFES